MANEKTPNYHWDIPNPYGLQIVEMMKVASTFGAIDSRFKAFEDAYLSHKHSFADITDRPTTLNGYGITDAITTDQVKSEIEASQTAQQSVIDQSIQSLANSTADALALRVRVDATQAFTLAQKSRARQNIDALGTVDRGVPNGVATLDAGGKIPSSQLPPVAISETFVVNSQSSMLALVAERGDIAVRPDLNKTFILRLEPATVLANWQEILTPADGVLSVNGLTGPVIDLRPSHLDLGNVANKSEEQMATSGAIADAIKIRIRRDACDVAGFVAQNSEEPYMRHTDQTLVRLQKALGFTPVSQGTGTWQIPHQTIHIGWGGSDLLLQVLETNFGNTWPIAIRGGSQSVNNMQLRTGRQQVAFNASGDGTITYSAFPTGVHAVVAVFGERSQGHMVSTEVVANGSFNLKHSYNNASAGGTHWVSWIATGY